MLIRSQFPCHPDRKVRVFANIRREFYDRRCPECGIEWTIERTELRHQRAGMRADKLDWTIESR